MKATETDRPANVNPDGGASGGEDPRVLQAVEEYLAALEAGQAPSREAFLSRHAAIAVRLGEYLDSLELIHRAGSAAGAVSDPAAAAVDLAGAEPLGDFLLVRELGRGGMGVVYEALQRSLNRRVALKVLPFAATLDPKQLQRFKNEAQAAAQLHHPNIVPVHGVGCERGVHYYAMQFIEGQTLAAVIAELRQQAGLEERHPSRPLSAVAQELLSGRRVPAQPCPANGPPTLPYRPQQPRPVPAGDTMPQAGLSTAPSIKSGAYCRAVASLGVQTAEALEHAHQLGVVHRDIKPANMLMDVRGNLWIADFGLAHCQGQAGLTMSGDLVGTLRYMSPEQALSKRALLDHRTDIYSLGVTLYELLTLEAPFAGHDREELLRRIANEEPRSPRRLNKSIPAELEILVLKAMDKNPADRYATAQELADDLRRFLEDKPIRARRPTLLQRARRWGRRHRAVVAATAVVLAMALVLLGGAAGWLVQRRLAAEAEALQALAKAEAWQQQARWPEARASAQRAEGLLTGGGGGPELQQHVRELLDDLEMVEKLEEIRLEQSQMVDGHFDIAGADDAYAQAFRAYGLDVEARGPEAAAWIRTRSIAVELSLALDNWAMARREGKGKTDRSWKQLLALARAADPDLPRTQVRQALETGDRAALEGLAHAVTRADLSASTLALLGRALEDLGAFAPAIALLREGQRRYPGDFWLNQKLAILLVNAKPPQLQEALRFLTVAVALRPQSAGAYVNLGLILDKQGQLDEAVAAYRKAIELRPFEALAYSNLGPLLQKQGRPDEAVALCQKAIELKPDYAEAYTHLGHALSDQGKRADALQAYAKALALKPDLFQAHYGRGMALLAQRKLPEAVEAFHKASDINADDFRPYGALGQALREQDRLDEAVAACRKAIALKPDCAEAYDQLGIALKEQGRLEEAVAAWHKAIELKPDYAEAYRNMGGQLNELGRLDEALAACRKAIALKPDDAEAHCNLGFALLSQGRRDQAVAACRKAIELQPDLANAYDLLGHALKEEGRLDEALTAFQKEIELQPHDAPGYYNLGNVLQGQGRLDEAIAAYRKAIALKADLAEAHCNLAKILKSQGKFEQALVYYRRGHEFGSRNSRWPYPSAEWVRRCERLLALDRKLPAILKGEVQPTDIAERLDLAALCQETKQLYATAVRFFEEAFAAQPALADDRQEGHRYNAACAAALSGCGKGKDAADLSEQEYERLRLQALSWLHADLAAWRSLLEKEPNKTRPIIVQQLRHWLADTDFTGVRSPEGLAQLPEAEQQTWRQFWGDVQRLLDQAKANSPAAARQKP